MIAGTRSVILRPVKVKYANSELERLEFEAGFDYGLGPNTVRAFRKCMQLIHAVEDEGDLYGFKGLLFEEPNGERSHHHLLRLSEQKRLVMDVEEGDPKNTICTIGIEDYH